MWKIFSLHAFSLLTSVCHPAGTQIREIHVQICPCDRCSSASRNPPFLSTFSATFSLGMLAVAIGNCRNCKFSANWNFCWCSKAANPHEICSRWITFPGSDHSHRLFFTRDLRREIFREIAIQVEASRATKYCNAALKLPVSGQSWSVKSKLTNLATNFHTVSISTETKNIQEEKKTYRRRILRHLEWKLRFLYSIIQTREFPEGVM